MQKITDKLNANRRRVSPRIRRVPVPSNDVGPSAHPCRYDIVGHSGEDYRVEFVHQDRPPKDNKQRLQVLKVSSQTRATSGKAANAGHTDTGSAAASSCLGSRGKDSVAETRPN